MQERGHSSQTTGAALVHRKTLGGDCPGAAAVDEAEVVTDR